MPPTTPQAHAPPPHKKPPHHDFFQMNGTSFQPGARASLHHTCDDSFTASHMLRRTCDDCDSDDDTDRARFNPHAVIAAHPRLHQRAHADRDRPPPLPPLRTGDETILSPAPPPAAGRAVRPQPAERPGRLAATHPLFRRRRLGRLAGRPGTPQRLLRIGGRGQSDCGVRRSSRGGVGGGSSSSSGGGGGGARGGGDERAGAAALGCRVRRPAIPPFPAA